MDQVENLLVKLQEISPLPEDSLLSEETMNSYERIVSELMKSQDARFIKPLIASFGYGTGFGLYQTIVGFLEQFPDIELEPHLIDALQKGQRGSRMWAASILKRNPNKKAIPFLLALLHDPEDLVRSEVVAALGAMREASVQHDIEQLRNDQSPIVRRSVERALKYMGV